MSLITPNKASHKNELDIARGQRLKKLRSMAAFTLCDFAKKLGVNRVTLSYWEKATLSGLSEEGAYKVISAIQKENIECSFEWLWEGKGNEPRFLPANNISTPSSTSEIESFFPSIQEEIQMFLRRNTDAVIAKIETHDLWPSFKFSDIVAGKWQPLDALDSECYCIINLDGALQVRWVKNINNRAYLSYSPDNKENERKEIDIKTIAPVIRVWR